MIEYCDLSELPVDQCGCRIHARCPTLSLGIFGSRPAPAIEAEWQTTCPACDGEIWPGDRIIRTDEGWTHRECVS